MAVAMLAAYVLPIVFDIAERKFRLHPLDWLARVVLSPSALFTDLFNLLYGLLYTSWYVLPVGAFCGVLLARRVASRGRRRAAVEAVALGLGVSVVGILILLVIVAVLLEWSLAEIFRYAAEAGSLLLLLWLYSSLWLVGLALWLGSERGSRPWRFPRVQKHQDAL
jgi:hypothetical protein